MSKYDNGRDPMVLDLHPIVSARLISDQIDFPPDPSSDRALLDRYLEHIAYQLNLDVQYLRP